MPGSQAAAEPSWRHPLLLGVAGCARPCFGGVFVAHGVVAHDADLRKLIAGVVDGIHHGTHQRAQPVARRIVPP